MGATEIARALRCKRGNAYKAPAPGKTALSHISTVYDVEPRGPLRVDLTRSPHRLATTAILRIGVVQCVVFAQRESLKRVIGASSIGFSPSTGPARCTSGLGEKNRPTGRLWPILKEPFIFVPAQNFRA
jgi:hypothetical protein